VTLRVLVVRYSVFAVIATIMNLGVQRFVFAHGSGGIVFVLAIGAGTFVGLLIKYVLDKRWIFYDLGTGM
jgi:putative flippase GtrA